MMYTLILYLRINDKFSRLLIFAQIRVEKLNAWKLNRKFKRSKEVREEKSARKNLEISIMKN